MLKKSEYTLNLLGLRCPKILMSIRKTVLDIKLFCTFMKHNIIYQNTTQIPLKFLIRNGLK